MEPLCHNPLCPNNREMVPKADMLCKDVRYFLGPIPGQPIRLCPVCTEVIRMVSNNPYGIRPEFFL